MQNLPPIQKAFCLIWRSQADADNNEWKEQLKNEVTRIGQVLNRVDQNITIINNNVNKLLREMALVHLEIGEVAIGAAAYNAIQDIRVYYNDFTSRINNLPDIKKGDEQATIFFGRVLQDAALHYKIDTICNALTESIAGKECLLRNIISQIAAKAEGKSLLDCYKLYEQYVNSIMLDLLKGNLVVEAAVLYFEVLASDPTLPKPKSPPFNTAQWKSRWNAQLRKVLDNFNNHLEWFVLTRYAYAARGINPFFIPADARWIFWCADAFYSSCVNEHGLRGRIFSMGGQFDGTVRFNNGTGAVGTKFEVRMDKKIDYWSATNASAPGVYDKVEFSDTWTVHRFHIRNAVVWTGELAIRLPYRPPPIEVETLSVTGDPAFGSFTEIARAGGGFAFFSGNWDEGRDDKDLSNRYDGVAPDVSKVNELRKVGEYVIRDGNLVLAAINRPEVGIAKGGWVHLGVFKFGTSGAPNDATHLNGSFRTWLQTAKTITFPALPNEHVNMVVSLIPSLQQLTDFPGAGTLNGWLHKGNRQKGDITDAQVLGKQVIAGANYDSTLAFPNAGCRVQGGVNLVPIAQGWPFEQAERTSSWQISQGTAQCQPIAVGLFREGKEASPRTTTFSFPYVPERGFKFRLQAFYDLSVETSGLNETPFAVYARGALDNVYFELAPGVMGSSRQPQTLQGLLGSAACRCIAFDYEGKGRPDHVIAYDPGTSRIGAFGRDGRERFAERQFVWGQYGYDYVSNAADRVLAYDYNGNGGLDHLVFHRPGTGRIAVLKDNSGTFSRVHDQSIQRPEPGDRAFFWDYNGSGRLDHLVVYRPGRGQFTVMKKNGAFSPICSNSNGIALTTGNYELKSTADRIFAFDYDGSGKLDHLVVYRQGNANIMIIKKNAYGINFAIVYQSSAGIDGYDLKGSADRGFAFDYNGTGKLDHLVFYRPGKGAIFIVKKNNDGTFGSVYGQGDPGRGIGPFDLANPADRVDALDFTGSGRLDHLMVYRPGSGLFWVLKNNRNGTFSRVFPE